MCGIAGIYNLDGAPVSVPVLKRMMDIQRHRGPDDAGARLFSLAQAKSEEVPPDTVRETTFEGALGFNRLSILDLSQNGHQPMANAEGNIVIAYNGEVYNAFDFREQLSAAGYKFRSRTDTEVILYLYQHFGLEGTLTRIRGMFAFCIVDLRKGEILLARDHLGIKPLYYTIQKGSLLFASEIKAFLPHPSFTPELSEQGLDEVLCFRFCTNERTLLRNVYQLPPGHKLRVGQGESLPQVTRYWEIPDGIEGGPQSMSAAVEKIESLLRDSVRRHLISDVKLGCQLSGGIDSSLVTYFARSHFNADMETFSVDFEDPAFSEAKWISQAAATANATSHKYMLDQKTILADIDRITWHTDRPANLPPEFGLYHLGRNACKKVTVLLSGEGSDELMGGYERFYWAGLRQRYGPVLRLIGEVPILNRRIVGPTIMKLSPEDAHIMSIAATDPTGFSLIRPEIGFESALELRRSIFAEGRGDYVANCLKYAMQTYLVHLLVHQDKIMMAHSIENRVPFVDVDVVEAVRRFPLRFTVSTGMLPRRAVDRNTKICLKKLASRVFDENFAYRPKIGFHVPLQHAFKTPEFQEILEDRIRPAILDRGWYRRAGVQACLNNPPPKEGFNRSSFWHVVSLEFWAQQFLDYSG